MSRTLACRILLACAAECAAVGTLPFEVAAQTRVPRFESGDCPFQPGAWARDVRLECGYLIVPEVRERPDGRTLRLAVAILRAKEPSGAPPLIMLHGGPGGIGGLRYWFPSGAAGWPLARHRDIVIYDLRGAGLSEPSLCPQFDAEGRSSTGAPSRQSDERYVANVRACVASLEARGIELAAYNTATNAADLIDLRRVLGYASWDIYGVSYGARLAQEAMRRDPQAIRSVVLASPLIPGPAGQVERPLDLQRTLGRIFEACTGQPPCRAAFPSLEQDFYALYDELSERPLEIRDERAVAPTPVRLDGERLLAAISGQLSSTREVARVPLLVHELRRGDRMRAARILVGSASLAGTRVLGNLVYCYDLYGAPFRVAAASISAQLRPPFRILVDDYEECTLWQRRFADPAEHALVRSDIPTLILTAEFDPRTPTELVRRITASLTRSYLHEIPGETHAQQPRGCHESILLQFLDNPTRKPDASCIATMPRISFATKDLAVPTLFLVITAAQNTQTEFAGMWEAEVPGGRVFTVDLKADGARLTGTFDPTQQAIPIHDGTIDGNTMTFRITSPDGDRTITFTGKIDGADIAFVRAVDVRPGGAPGGAGIFGTLGARTFTAKRAR